MSQPVMASPIIISLSGRRKGKVFLILTPVAARKPIAVGRQRYARILIIAHHYITLNSGLEDQLKSLTELR